MGARTTGREAALQMIFALEANGGSAERVINQFWRETHGGRTPPDPVLEDIQHALLDGVLAVEVVDAHRVLLADPVSLMRRDRTASG